MARPVTMMMVTLSAAAAAGLLPQLTSATDPAPPSNVVSLRSTGASGGTPGTGAPPAGAVPTALVMTVDPVKVVRPVGGAQSLPFERTWLARDAERTVLLRNDTSAPVMVTLEPDVKALDRQGREQKAALTDVRGGKIDPFEMGINEEKVLTIRVSPSNKGDFPLPATGFLKITSTRQDTKTSKTTFQEITIPEGLSPGIAGLVFLLCLSTAVVLVVGAAIRLRSAEVDLLGPMGNPTWISQQSWGVNLAIGATLLTALLSLGFPEHPWLMTKASFTLLQGIFAALVGLAPLIYGLFQGAVQIQVADSTGASVASVDRQGNVLLFLLTGGLILWGALGGAVMLFLSLLEFVRDDFIDPLIGGILLLLAALICLLLVSYGWRALYQRARYRGIAGEAPPRRSMAPALQVGEAVPEAAQARLSGPVYEWPLL